MIASRGSHAQDQRYTDYMARESELPGHQIDILDGPVSFDPFEAPVGVTPIGDCGALRRGAIRGTVECITVERWGVSAALGVVVRDATGSLKLTFVGREQLAGVVVGRVLTAGGSLLTCRGERTMLNPFYWLGGPPADLR